MVDVSDKFKKILSKYYRIKMGDGSVWAIPVGEIAAHRAEYYMPDFGGDLVKSLYEDTLPLFSLRPLSIKDWASQHMTWDDVFCVATQIKSPTSTKQYQGDWNCAVNTEVK